MSWFVGNGAASLCQLKRFPCRPPLADSLSIWILDHGTRLPDIAAPGKTSGSSYPPQAALARSLARLPGAKHLYLSGWLLLLLHKPICSKMQLRRVPNVTVKAAHCTRSIKLSSKLFATRPNNFDQASNRRRRRRRPASDRLALDSASLDFSRQPAR